MNLLFMEQMQNMTIIIFLIKEAKFSKQFIQRIVSYFQMKNLNLQHKLISH